MAQPASSGPNKKVQAGIKDLGKKIADVEKHVGQITKLHDKLDGASENEKQLQTAMQQLSQAIELASNAMKSAQQAQNNIVKNIK